MINPEFIRSEAERISKDLLGLEVLQESIKKNFFGNDPSYIKAIREIVKSRKTLLEERKQNFYKCGGIVGHSFLSKDGDSLPQGHYKLEFKIPISQRCQYCGQCVRHKSTQSQAW